MHHKRKGPKSTRAGCLRCKPHKDQRRKDTLAAQPVQERRQREANRVALVDLDSDLSPSRD